MIPNKAYNQMDKDSREKTIEEFLPVIKHLAYKVARGFENENLIDDLISAGIVGLLEVMEKYDSTRGAKLNTFAYLRIRGAMIDELRSRDWFPRSARAKAKRYSLRWFLYIHLPIPLIFIARTLSHIEFKYIPVLVLAAITGQILGGKLDF